MLRPVATEHAIELARALLTRMVARRRASANAFGVSSEDVVAVLAKTSAVADPSHDAAVERAAAALAAALERDATSRLARLVRAFALSELDVAIVSVLLAPELEHDIERVIAFGLDDFTRKRPDIGFVARLIGDADGGRSDETMVRLDDAAPLLRFSIVVKAPATREQPGTMRAVRLADRVVSFMRGQDPLDELARGFVHVSTSAASREQLVLHADLIARIARALDGSAPRLLLAGPEGAGRALAVEALFVERSQPAIRVDLAAIVGDGRIGERVAAAIREAALRNAAAIMEGDTAIADAPPPALVHAIKEAATGLSTPLVFTLPSRPLWLANALPELAEVTVPAPSFRERQELWRRAIPSSVAASEDLETVAARYAFTGGIIARTARRAMRAAALRDPDAMHVTLDDLGDAARLTFANRLGGMAQRIATGFAWSDLVLPRDTAEAVREVVRFARHRPFLLEEWGFAAKLPYGRGVSAILAGPPGTGKTMVAQLLAMELGYDLYRIDLSQVVNKYIGETEKNLAKIFDEAETSHAVLFFDEADSLFSKRTDVKSSNDRYANLEVNYLLQRMETYDGVTLLATNLEQGLDEAFKRRVRFSIAFELPEEDERRKLWRSMFPSQVPLAPDIDWDLIAKKFVMAGGYIKKAALRAALIAVDAKREVTTADLLEAARQEYREMGRIV